jgi:tripartite-type tricarboxylate transporter receptor subunit TctC
VVVAAPPGGASDTLARLLAEQIGRTQRLTILVENRPGAGTAIGTEAVSRAAPDGNTLLIVAPPFIINPHLRKLNYDPLTNFEPICNLVQSPSFIVVNSASPYRTLGDLLSAARAKSDVTLAGAGPATSLHIALEMLKRAAGVNMTFVPFPGDTPAVNALLGEHVTSAFAPYSGVAEHLKVGKLRALAVAGRARFEPLVYGQSLSCRSTQRFPLPPILLRRLRWRSARLR